ncbi:MAG TPA: hypothetical protein VGB87_16355 [Vicinamibacteria bacterium]
MSALNCWEFKGCGREPGGRHAAEKGVCPAAVFSAADGYLGGRNGGRACAYVTGTFCEDVLQGTFRDKSKACWDCEFYRMLREEHGAAVSMPGFTIFLLDRDSRACRDFFKENWPGGGSGR